MGLLKGDGLWDEMMFLIAVRLYLQFAASLIGESKHVVSHKPSPLLISAHVYWQRTFRSHCSIRIETQG